MDITIKTKYDVYERILSFVKDIAHEPEYICSTDTLEHLGFDSLDIMDLRMDIDSLINVDDIEIKSSNTISEITNNVWNIYNESR